MNRPFYNLCLNLGDEKLFLFTEVVLFVILVTILLLVVCFGLDQVYVQVFATRLS